MSKEDNSLKTNGLDPMQRLASFKAPRDLTLGSNIKPNKKTFVPNLNVARNKNKNSIPNIKDHKNETRAKRERNDKNKNFKHTNKIIKSGGVFSEGMAAVERHPSRVSYGSRESDSTQTLQKPTIKVNDFVKFNKELEDQKIKTLLGENDGLDEETEDFKKVLEKDAPVKLPLDEGHYNVIKPNAVKKEVVVKSEPQDDVYKTMPVVDKYACPAVKEDIFEDLDVFNVLKSEKPTLLLLQLPDSLPGRGGSVDDGQRHRQTTSTEPSTSTGAAENNEQPVDNRCRLSDLEEGRIGKLQVHRSGRISLLLGDSKFDVCSGTKSVFHMEAVSVAADDATRSANIVSLGPLHHKLNVEPDWEAMFCDITV